VAEIGLHHRRVGGDRGWRAARDDAPLVEDMDMLGEADHRLHHVLDQQDGDAAVADRPHHAHDLRHLGRVQPRHHLVEQQQPRRGGERAGELETLATRDREVARAHVEHRAHADGARDALGRRLGLGAARVAQPGADHDVLAHAQPREGLRDLERAHHARARDDMRRATGDVLAREAHRARVGPDEAGDGREAGRLARAVGPDQRHDRALRHVEVDAIDRLQPAEGPRQAAHLKHRGLPVGPCAGQRGRSARLADARRWPRG
jgi:hypothetical protein